MVATMTRDLQAHGRVSARATCAPLSVLLADDDTLTRTLIRDLVEPISSEVMEASDGKSASIICRTSQPDVLILDLVMPEQDGFETLAILRAQFPEMRIIVMSGAFDGMLLRAARRLGADATLLKPFTPSELMTAVTGRD